MKQIMKFFLLFLFVISFNKVNAQSVGGTTSGAATYCSTTNSGFVTLSGYVGTILNWQSSTDGGVTWNFIASTTPNQTYFNLNQTTCYQAIVQNGAFPPDSSTIVCITIYAESVGGSISGGGIFCVSTGPGTLILSGYAGSILYWQSSIDGGASWVTIANTTPTENYLNITQNTLYWAVVQNGAMCPTDTSSQASFIINPATVAGSIGGAASVCALANAGILNLSGYTGTIQSWSYSTTGGAPWTSISNTTSMQSYLNLPTTTWYHAIVQSGSCSLDSTADVIIAVSSPSFAGTISGGGVYCGGSASGTLTLTGYIGSILEWNSSTTSGASWSTIPNTSPTEIFTTLSTTTWYSAIVQNIGCSPDTASIEIVDVLPMSVSGSITSAATVCSGINFDTLILSGNVGNITSWISSIDSGSTWLPITNNTTTQVYNGLTTTTWFTAIVQNGGCVADTATYIAITVLPPFSVFAGNDTVITSGQQLILNGIGTGTPLWTPASSLNNAGIYSPSAAPTVTTTYVLSVTDLNGCMNSDDILITVVPNVFNGMVSNLFTPNDDGVNDSWYIEEALNYPDIEVFVYNIYGNEVFSKKGYTNDWNGTYKGDKLPDGTYYYVIRFDNSSRIVKGAIDILKK